MRSNKDLVLFGFITNKLRLDNRCPMFANDGANCQVRSANIKPCFYSQKLGFFCIKTKTLMYRPKKVTFFCTLAVVAI